MGKREEKRFRIIQRMKDDTFAETRETEVFLATISLDNNICMKTIEEYLQILINAKVLKRINGWLVNLERPDLNEELVRLSDLKVAQQESESKLFREKIQPIDVPEPPKPVEKTEVPKPSEDSELAVVSNILEEHQNADKV